MPPSLIVFDLDGTLIDSAADLAAAVNATLASFGCKPLAESAVRSMVGDGVAMLVARALAASRCDRADPLAAARLFLQHYESDATSRTTLYPAVRETLEALRADAIPLAVCTNKPARITAAILESLGLAPYFARVLAGDSLPFRKPDPRVLATLLAPFAAAPQQSLMVGDSEVDAAMARAAGVPFVLMKHGYHRGPVAEIPAIAALDGFGPLVALARNFRG